MRKLSMAGVKVSTPTPPSPPTPSGRGWRRLAARSTPQHQQQQSSAGATAAAAGGAGGGSNSSGGSVARDVMAALATNPLTHLNLQMVPQVGGEGPATQSVCSAVVLSLYIRCLRAGVFWLNQGPLTTLSSTTPTFRLSMHACSHHSASPACRLLQLQQQHHQACSAAKAYPCWAVAACCRPCAAPWSASTSCTTALMLTTGAPCASSCPCSRWVWVGGDTTAFFRRVNCAPFLRVLTQTTLAPANNSINNRRATFPAVLDFW